MSEKPGPCGRVSAFWVVLVTFWCQTRHHGAAEADGDGRRGEPGSRNRRQVPSSHRVGANEGSPQSRHGCQDCSREHDHASWQLALTPPDASMTTRFHDHPVLGVRHLFHSGSACNIATSRYPQHVGKTGGKGKAWHRFSSFSTTPRKATSAPTTRCATKWRSPRRPTPRCEST